MNTEKQNKNYKKWLVIGGVLVLLVAAAWWFSRSTPTKPTPPTSPTPTAGPGFGQVGTGTPAPTVTEPPTKKVTDPQTNREVEVVRNRILIRFKDGATQSEKEELWNSLGAVETKDVGLLNIYGITLAEDKELEPSLEKCQSSLVVEYCQFDGIVESSYAPNDPMYSQQQFLSLMNAERAWDLSRGDSAVTVGVLDTGVWTGHSDLNARVVNNPQMNDGYEGPGKGCVPGNCPSHATHVAGLACAQSDNSTGVASVGFNCSVLGVQALHNSGSGTDFEIIGAIKTATDQGVDIINMSLGGPYSSRATQDAVTYAWDNGVLVLAAAGNSGSSARSYPAAYDRVISVAATHNNSKGKAGFSNFGSWVDVATPGENVLSTIYADSREYLAISGTSMATPVASGLAALCKASNPSLTNSDIEQIFFSNAEGNSYTRYGFLMADKILEACTDSEPLPTPTPTQAPEESAISCFPEEWQCTDDDVVDPEQKCCQCGAIIAPTPPYDRPCRTNEDEGQKDGTGRTGKFRQYRWYDPDIGKVVQAPPVAAPREIRPIFPTP